MCFFGKLSLRGASARIDCADDTVKQSLCSLAHITALITLFDGPEKQRGPVNFMHMYKVMCPCFWSPASYFRVVLSKIHAQLFLVKGTRVEVLRVYTERFHQMR